MYPCDEILLNLKKVESNMEAVRHSCGRKDHVQLIAVSKTKPAEDIQALMEHIENESQYETKVILNLAVNYGGRHEITEGVKEIAQKVKNGEILPEDITEDMISASLYTKDIPDPDLIIRPSGEYRLSNFLTWQSAYAEFWFSNVLWPDFTEENLCEALREFEKRNRRFGGV